ncbi:MAG: hypothetical protein KatS3mg011_0644 [Acidimicrobiia bacterium]|nr:MAG: hypothetical protein KatS3mg011_0644 [Acidimicrobiia bacterium]
MRRYPPERLIAFAEQVLRAVGVRPDHGRVTAQRLVEADMRGRGGHGLIRLPLYVSRIEAGGVNLDPDIRVVRENRVSALVDGDNGLGQPVMTLATEIAIAKAREEGVAWVGTVHSNHAGAAGVYTAMALRHDLAAIYFAVANGNAMPPWGGKERLLGTNPIAAAFPAGEEIPFQLDIATTVASHGSIKVKAQAGEPLPEGWVVDEEGRPITDPDRADEGFLLPIGGYKGAGLTFMIGVLAGIMNGAAFGRDVVEFRKDLGTPTNTGQAILVLRPDLFIDMEEYRKSMDRHLRDFRSSASMTGDRVRLPGEWAWEREQESLRLGVPLPEELVVRLDELAQRVGSPARLG